MATAFLGLGSNMGDRADNINIAIKLLRESGQIDIENISSLYQTEPVGVEGQPEFYNCAMRIKTPLDPHPLLRLIKAIERQMGREPSTHMQPRLIDIDILLYDDTDLESLELKIPHPRLTTRRFVLEPLLELEPGLRDPISSRPLKDFLAFVARQDVRRIGGK
jgi:2-amino-4-hydroxy-6-hydroxymethyldihydropteridine diphosphokinase